MEHLSQDPISEALKRVPVPRRASPLWTSCGNEPVRRSGFPSTLRGRQQVHGEILRPERADHEYKIVSPRATQFIGSDGRRYEARNSEPRDSVGRPIQQLFQFQDFISTDYTIELDAHYRGATVKNSHPLVLPFISESIMPESAHKILLDRTGASDAITKAYGPQLDLLTDMVNYASNLIPRAYAASEEKLRDVIVCFVLLKQFATMLDAVEVLARAGAIYAALVPARVAFEASLYIEWMLVADGEKKATYYYVANIRSERLWGLRVAKGSAESANFFEEMRQLGDDLLAKYKSMDETGRSRVEHADAILALPQYREVNSDFEAWKVRNKKRRLHEPEWYKILGKESVRSIAKELHRLADYRIYYGKGSAAVHSAEYKDHVKFMKEGTVGSPIRDLSQTYNVLQFALSNAQFTFMRVLGFYRPAELQSYRRKYLEEWRAPFLSRPNVEFRKVVQKKS